MSEKENHGPVNLGPGYRAMEIDCYVVSEWCELPDGRGPASQVWLRLVMKDPLIPELVLRLKTARAVDELIDTLMKHREGVFGPRTKRRRS